MKEYTYASLVNPESPDEVESLINQIAQKGWILHSYSCVGGLLRDRHRYTKLVNF